MSSRRAKIIILCEGAEDYYLARDALMRMGWKKRMFESRICPAGKQAGEQFVRQKYPGEVRAQRTSKGSMLLVCTDADGKEVSERVRQLDTALKAAGERPRGRREGVALWIPSRNLETWVYLYAHGGPVNELINYKGYKYKLQEADFQVAARRLGDDLKRRVAPSRTCPSLARAFVETDRIRD
jgi:hypothetical protein